MRKYHTESITEDHDLRDCDSENNTATHWRMKMKTPWCGTAMVKKIHIHKAPS